MSTSTTQFIDSIQSKVIDIYKSYLKTNNLLDGPTRKPEQDFTHI